MKTINRTLATVSMFDFEPSTGCTVPRDPFELASFGEPSIEIVEI